MENVAHETEKAISGAIKIDEKEIQDHIDGLVRQSVEDTLNALLNAEADAICNAGRYQRTPDRLDTRAGSCHRKLLTKAGEVDLKVPRLRSLPFETEIIRRYQTKQSSVEEALIEMYLAGVSVRRVEDITEALWGAKVSPSTVSDLNQKIYGKIEEWRMRPINEEHPYVFVDGVYLKRSWGGEVQNVSVLVAVGVNQDGYREILGIAGIAGSGQRELLEAIAGLQASEKGSSIVYQPSDGQAVNLVGKSPKAIRSLGIALSFVPEDRLGMGLVGNMDIVDNMMLRSYKRGHTAFLERKRPKDLAENIIKSLEIVTPDANTPVRRLSGGNVQKVLVGREIAQHPTVLMVAYPVRGLDINSSYMIYNLLQKQKESGVSVIFVGEDLDVLVELCDRIMVLNSGRITGIVDGPSATKEELGILMTKRVKEEGETHA
mgnify:CR=1 FL=1